MEYQSLTASYRIGRLAVSKEFIEPERLEEILTESKEALPSAVKYSACCI